MRLPQHQVYYTSDRSEKTLYPFNSQGALNLSQKTFPSNYFKELALIKGAVLFLDS